MFPNVERWLLVIKSLPYFYEANKGLQEWKRALEEKEKETSKGLEALTEEEQESSSESGSVSN